MVWANGENKLALFIGDGKEETRLVYAFMTNTERSNNSTNSTWACHDT